MSYYVVYCIIEAKSLPLDLADDDLTLTTVEAAELAAIISPTAKKRARPSRANILQHQQVNEHIMAQVDTLLPMRFGVIADSAADVAQNILAAQADVLKERLEAVRDRVEFSVKAIWPEETLMAAVRDRAPELTTVDVEALSLNQRIELGKQVEAVAQTIHADVARDLMAALAEVSVEAVEQTIKDGATSLDGAFLIARTDEAALEKAVERCSQTLPGALIIKIVGPLPAYSFANLTLEATGVDLPATPRTEEEDS